MGLLGAMMGSAADEVIGELAVKVTVDSTPVKKGLEKVKREVTNTSTAIEGSTGKIRQRALKAVPAALAVGGALAAGAIKGVNAASDLDEAMNKSSVVFGKFAKDIPGFGGSVASQFGMARSEALDLAGGIGALQVSLGLSKKEAAENSAKLIKLAADMGSLHNADPTEMMERYRSGLSGSTEVLDQYGINLKEAGLAQEARRLGIKKDIKAMSEQEKTQLRLSKIMWDGRIANDDFANTADSLANKKRILAAQAKDLAAKMGKDLYPSAKLAAGIMSKILGFLQKHPKVLKVVLALLTTFVALVLGAAASMKIAHAVWLASNAVMGIWNALVFVASGRLKAWIAQNVIAKAKLVATTVATKAAAAAQWLLNVAMSANPIMLIVLGLAALAVGLVIAYKKSEKFRKVVDKTFSWLQKAGKAIIDFFKQDWRKIKDLWMVPFLPLVILAKDAFGIRSGLIRALDWLRSAAKSKASAVFRALKNGLTQAMGFPAYLRRQITEKITAFLGAAKRGGQSIAVKIWEGLKAWAAQYWNGAKLLSDYVGKFFSSAGGFLKNTVTGWGKNIGRAIARGLGIAIQNTALAPLNKLIGFINLVGDKIERFLPFVGTINNIPPLKVPKAYARGGVVNRPTLGVFGEAGPEALIPLGRGKREHALPLLEKAAAAHGMSLFRFGAGGWVKSQLGKLNPAKASGKLLSTLASPFGNLLGRLPGLPDSIGPKWGGRDIGRRFAKFVLGKAKGAVGGLFKGAMSKIGFGGGGGGGKGLFKGGVFPVLGGSVGGGPSAHLSRALGNWMSDWAYDLMARENSLVRAAYAGTIGSVNRAANVSGQFWGKSFYQSVPGGTLWYKHLKQVFVRPGQRVAAGQPVGTLGGTGVLYGGPHLHIGANPMSLLYGLPGLSKGGVVRKAGIAHVDEGDVHRGPHSSRMGGLADGLLYNEWLVATGRKSSRSNAILWDRLFNQSRRFGRGAELQDMMRQAGITVGAVRYYTPSNKPKPVPVTAKPDIPPGYGRPDLPSYKKSGLGTVININVLPGTGVTREQARQLAREIGPYINERVTLGVS